MNIQDKKAFFQAHIAIYEQEIGIYIWKKVYNEHDTSDILQTVFLNAWKSLEQLHSVDNTRSWLYTIASNCVSEHFRRLATQQRYGFSAGEKDPSTLLESVTAETDPVLTEIVERFKVDLAFQALTYLSPQDRELINMRYIDEIGIKRMVEVTGLKEKTLSSKLSRALKKYKQIYFALEAGKEVEIPHGKAE